MVINVVEVFKNQSEDVITEVVTEIFVNLINEKLTVEIERCL